MWIENSVEREELPVAVAVMGRIVAELFGNEEDGQCNPLMLANKEQVLHKVAKAGAAKILNLDESAGEVVELIEKLQNGVGADLEAIQHDEVGGQNCSGCVNGDVVVAGEDLEEDLVCISQ